MRYAVLNAGKIERYQEIPDFDNMPTHRKEARDEKGDGGPVYRPVLTVGSGPQKQIEIHLEYVLEKCSHPSLDVMKERYIKKVEDAFEQIIMNRRFHAGPGKMFLYAEKAAQARDIIDMGEDAANALDADAARANYPAVAATVGIEGPTLWDVALLIESKYEKASDELFYLERTRQTARKAISDASDAAQVEAAYGAIRWAR